MSVLDVDFAQAEAICKLVTLEEEKHRYFRSGDELPGCTTILEDVKIDDYSTVPDYILEPAQQRGRAVHLARHLDDESNLDESTCTDEVLGHVEGWRKFRRDTQFQPLLSEQRVYAPKGNARVMPFAGTLDALGIVPNPARLVLPDLKTGQVPNGVGPQTAGYALCLRLLGIADVAERWCVQTFADGTYKVHPLKSRADEPAFCAAAWLWYWKRGLI